MDQVAKIQVGEFKGNCAFTITYTSGDSKLVIMGVDIAERFVDQLSKVIHELRYVERQMGHAFVDGVGLGESVGISLTQPVEEQDGTT